MGAELSIGEWRDLPHTFKQGCAAYLDTLPGSRQWVVPIQRHVLSTVLDGWTLERAILERCRPYNTSSIILPSAEFTGQSIAPLVAPRQRWLGSLFVWGWCCTDVDVTPHASESRRTGLNVSTTKTKKK